MLITCIYIVAFALFPLTNEREVHCVNNVARRTAKIDCSERSCSHSRGQATVFFFSLLGFRGDSEITVSQFEELERLLLQIAGKCTVTFFCCIVVLCNGNQNLSVAFVHIRIGIK